MSEDLIVGGLCGFAAGVATVMLMLAFMEEWARDFKRGFDRCARFTRDGVLIGWDANALPPVDGATDYFPRRGVIRVHAHRQ